MPRSPSRDTSERIQAVALELFAEQGIEQTSLRQIAEHVGVTKPALYYHFTSREDLLRSLLQPLVDDVEVVLGEDEARAAAGEVNGRDLLGRYFDVCYRHRALMALLVRDLTPLSQVGFVEYVLQWRRRLMNLLVGHDADTTARARAIVALGGLGDCLVMLADTPADELRAAALDAACAALERPGSSGS